LPDGTRDHRSNPDGDSGSSEGSSVADWFAAITSQAEAAMQSGDYATSESLGREMIERDPANPLGWRVVALSQDQQGDRQGAQATVDEGLAYAPQDPGLQGLKRVLAKSGPAMEFDTSKLKKNFKDKEDDLKKEQARRTGSMNMIAKGPGGAAGPAGPGGAGEKMLPAQITKHAKPMSFAKPEAHTGFTRRGLQEVQAGDLISGIRQFTKAIKKNPRDNAALRWRALARHRAGDYEGAIEDADRALALADKDHWALKTKAMALLALKRADEALAAADKAVEALSTDADAFRTRAMIHKARGDTAAMIQDLAQAAALDPQFAALYRRELAKAEKEDAEEDEEERGGDTTKGTLFAVAALIIGGGLATALTKKKKPAKAESAALGVTGFDVSGKLGQGGMGEVWRATDRALQREVAIKRLRSEIAGDERMRKKFLKEARTVAALKHANIVEIHSVIEEGDELLLVFEHLDGQPLDAILAEHGKLTLDQTLEIVKQAAAALDYAHQQGVIHQDLKPGNVMVAGETVKVMDFGIARRVADDLSTLSRQEVSGTPVYMAPEQEAGNPTPQSDVYALGLCFYEMLTGRRANPKQGFPPLVEALPGTPPALDGVLAYTLDADPAKRYPTAGQLASAIEQVVAASRPS
jgi:tetratricopeptide (TPR) repeat protein/tRNA A-37 threonylcarbamoyl transferase component Bud32